MKKEFVVCGVVVGKKGVGCVEGGKNWRFVFDGEFGRRGVANGGRAGLDVRREGGRAAYTGLFDVDRGTELEDGGINNGGPGEGFETEEGGSENGGKDGVVDVGGELEQTRGTDCGKLELTLLECMFLKGDVGKEGVDDGRKG